MPPSVTEPPSVLSGTETWSAIESVKLSDMLKDERTKVEMQIGDEQKRRQRAS